MAIRPPAIFFLPNTTTLLARSAINLLRSATQALLDEAITTLQNRSLSATDVMNHLEQNVNFAEVLQKLAKEWLPETQRTFAVAFNMDPAKTDVMDLIVAIAILNEADLEAELRGENTPQATVSDLLGNRKITWQYPPPGTLLDPPYLVLVAVEHVDTTVADSEVQAILGELVDYKGYKIPKRTSPPLGPLPGKLDSLVLREPRIPLDFRSAITDVAVVPPQNSAATPPAATSTPVAQPFSGIASEVLGRSKVLQESSRLFKGGF